MDDVIGGLWGRGEQGACKRSFPVLLSAYVQAAGAGAPEHHQPPSYLQHSERHEY